MVAAADHIVADALRRQGWSVLTHGWPDLLVYNDQRRTVMAVELKRGNDRLRPEQVEMGRVFVERIGVPFHVVRDRDIEAIMRKTGRVIAPGASLEKLRGEVEDTRVDLAIAAKQLAAAHRRVAELEQLVEQSTAVFTPDIRHHWEVQERQRSNGTRWRLGEAPPLPTSCEIIESALALIPEVQP